MQSMVRTCWKIRGGLLLLEKSVAELLLVLRVAINLLSCVRAHLYALLGLPFFSLLPKYNDWTSFMLLLTSLTSSIIFFLSFPTTTTTQKYIARPASPFS